MPSKADVGNFFGAIGQGILSGSTGTPLGEIREAAKSRQQADKQRRLIEKLQSQAGQPGALQGDAFRELAASDPVRALNFAKALGTSDFARQRAIFEDAQKSLELLKLGDIQGVNKLLASRIQGAEQLGFTPTSTVNFAEKFQKAQEGGINPEEMADLAAELAGFVEAGNQVFNASREEAKIKQREIALKERGLTLKEKKFKAGGGESFGIQKGVSIPGLGFGVLSKSGEVSLKEFTPDQQEKIQLAQKRQADLKAMAAESRASGTARGKGSAGRQQEFINVGVDAAEGIPVIRRSLELMEIIKTGGIDKAAFTIKQLFGVEGADEAELSGNLGKAVLSQLKATFGAQFTEKEGDRLDRIEANIGKSTAGNKRLLEQTLRIATNAVKRAIKSAENTDDFDTAEELQRFLDGEFDLSLEGKIQKIEGLVGQAAPPVLDIGSLGAADLGSLTDEQLQQLVAQ